MIIKTKPKKNETLLHIKPQIGFLSFELMFNKPVEYSTDWVTQSNLMLQKLQHTNLLTASCSPLQVEILIIMKSQNLYKFNIAFWWWQVDWWHIWQWQIQTGFRFYKCLCAARSAALCGPVDQIQISNFVTKVGPFPLNTGLNKISI